MLLKKGCIGGFFLFVEEDIRHCHDVGDVDDAVEVDVCLTFISLGDVL